MAISVDSLGRSCSPTLPSLPLIDHKNRGRALEVTKKTGKIVGKILFRLACLTPGVSSVLCLPIALGHQIHAWCCEGASMKKEAQRKATAAAILSIPIAGNALVALILIKGGPGHLEKLLLTP